MLKRFACVLALAFAGCGGCTVNEQYVAADRLTFNAVAPVFRSYVEQDQTLTLDEKARRFRVLDTWEVRIQHAEGVK